MRCERSYLCLFIALSVAACGSDTTGPHPTPTDTIVLTADVLKSLDSTAVSLEQSNPGNFDLKSLVDSTLLTLSAGVEARRLDVGTDLTTAPLYFIGVHRAFVRGTGSSFSTWTLIGFDDPIHLTTLVEVGGFAQIGGESAPSSVSGTIGDGTGIVNSLFLRVGAANAVTEWIARSGSASFVSDTPGAACPGFAPTAKVACSLEAMHVHFTAQASGGTGGATARQASLSVDVAAPGMRLTFTP